MTNSKELNFIKKFAKRNSKGRVTHCIYCDKILTNNRPNRGYFCGNDCNYAMLKHIRMNKLLKMANGDQINITYGQSIELKKKATNCEICNRELDYKNNPNMVIIDHCHKTKTFRGIICNPCNRMLGWRESHGENPANYLKGIKAYDNNL